MFEFRRKLNAYRRNAAGNVAIVTALASVVILALAGSAVDYIRISQLETSLNDAADTAILAATTRAQKLLAGGSSAWQQQAISDGNAYFKNNAPKITTAAGLTSSLKVSQSAGAVTATLTYDAKVPLSFMSLFGIKKYHVANTVTATTGGQSTYANIVFLIDNSAHMGVGATAADQQTLVNTVGCALACHYNNVWSETDTMAKARAAGASLRIDVIKKAVSDALATLQNSPASSHLNVEIDTFSNGMLTPYPLSSDIGGAINAVSNLDLTNLNQDGGTNIDYSLQQLTSKLNKAGTGTASKPLGYVILVTDGVMDSNEYVWSNGVGSLMTAQADPHFTTISPSQSFPSFGGTPVFSGMDPASCDKLKSNGHTLLTLNVEYLIPTIAPDSNDTRFAYIKQSVMPVVAPRMAACASDPTLALSANSPSEIESAMQELLAKIIKAPVHLSE